MSDNLQERGPRDRQRINVNEEWELRYWADTFGVSQETLRNAVDKVGVNVERVREHLRR